MEWLVGGDSIGITVDVGPETVRPSPGDRARPKSIDRSSPRVISSPGPRSDDALLVVAPDPTVCFAQSAFRQEQRYNLTDSASLVVVDWITSGRRAMGESWAFDRYSRLLEISREGRRVLYDSVLLGREDGPLDERMGRLQSGRRSCCSARSQQAKPAQPVATIAATCVGRGAGAVVSAAALENDGALLRVAGQSVEEVGAILRQHQFSSSPSRRGGLGTQMVKDHASHTP